MLFSFCKDDLPQTNGRCPAKRERLSPAKSVTNSCYFRSRSGTFVLDAIPLASVCTGCSMTHPVLLLSSWCVPCRSEAGARHIEPRLLPDWFDDRIVLVPERWC